MNSPRAPSTVPSPHYFTPPPVAALSAGEVAVAPPTTSSTPTSTPPIAPANQHQHPHPPPHSHPPHPQLQSQPQSPNKPLRPSPEQRVLESSRKLTRNVSPGLLARMKLFNQGGTPDTSRPPLPASIGRISERKIRELDEFHRDRGVRIERRGTTWSNYGSAYGSVHGSGAGSQASTPLIPQLTGDSVPALKLAMDQSPPPGFESDRSSFVSTSDRVLPSDSEAGDAPSEETQKYRLPDISATKTLTPTPSTPTIADDAVPLTRPPTPPPKDMPPPPPAEPPSGSPEEPPSVLDSENGIDVESYFQRRHLSRANSIYTLSRLSFTNQIQQLTSITLPPPDSLSSEISALPSSTAAARALHGAAGSIRLWMAKASEVLNGLDAEDDVEWAAAAGREGLAEVDTAIGKFEGLVNVYITAIEDLHNRPDVASLPTRDLTTLVTQMEEVVSGWSKIKHTLKDIKVQVEIAMEWEELWNTVLGEIGLEVETLSRHIFEMEERRHRAISDSVAESAEKFDIADLETIVEETPRQHAREQSRVNSNRFSVPPSMTVTSPMSPIPQIEQENSKLLALFAKLQPLRASLDFLPMRLSSFQMRAKKTFPSACDELMRRKDQLEKLETKLEADADALREELGEDKWVHSFRQAGSKAIAMYDSLMKSMQRLRQAINENDDEKLTARISTYKDRRQHYPPSMKRVLQLIDIEMKHRSTVNGEILRIQQDVRQKVSDLASDMKDMDMVLEEIAVSRRLRDSVSTLSSRTEASLCGSAFGTPNSSPASSIVINRSNTPSGRKPRPMSTSYAKSSVPANRRYSSLPMSESPVPRKSLTASRLETVSSAYPSRAMSATPTRSVRSTTPAPESSSSKPRWNGSTNMRDTPLPATPGSSSLSASSTTPPRRVQIAESEDSSAGSERSPTPRQTPRSASAMNSRRSSMLPTPKKRAPSVGSNMNVPTIATPGRSSSRLGNIEEGRRSKLGLSSGRLSSAETASGRKSSTGVRSHWR
ncbi:KAR9-domain-containing protein [Massarina eburnea CBS 473.64]|uniref:KAR9-domain-containing protein n=1 Tax=Massarina eburnea CBS 473.64 TaxID=1395130 RepID=A0A6A6RMM5_9PLEO|nr:KAR9-domain-containing protein [Massarina eburnea CBS 473.64]